MDYIIVVPDSLLRDLLRTPPGDADKRPPGDAREARERRIVNRRIDFIALDLGDTWKFK